MITGGTILRLAVRQKLLILILPLCLIPFIGISFFSYFQAKDRITEDRIALYLEQIARSVSTTLRLSLVEREEEVRVMGLFFTDFLKRPRQDPPLGKLDEMVSIHQVYDLLILFDIQGRILLTNHRPRGGSRESALDKRVLASLMGRDLIDFTPNDNWLQNLRAGNEMGYINWHRSPLVEQLYDYGQRDIALQYSIGFAAPIYDDRQIVVGGLLGLMSWEHIQEILDVVEEEFSDRSLASGYGFLFGRDGDTIIGHKYRSNRSIHLVDDEGVQNNYSTSLTRDHQVEGLAAVVREMLDNPVDNEVTHVGYEYPLGTAKISGLAELSHDPFSWICGVGVDNRDIFGPVQDLKNILVLAALVSSLLIVAITFFAARQFTTPLKKLTTGAQLIAAGDLTERMPVTSRDEIGELARTFNEMRQSLQERSQALIELNHRLEEKVRDRTKEIEVSHRKTEEAYQNLKEAQVQLVQSEKMASLGQLVAGIAHEIKNPLNFIYGNTDFLKSYIGDLKELISVFEEEANLTPEAEARVSALREEKNFKFITEDLNNLIQNFEEGSKRINDIIGDLRTFSRMDSDELLDVNIHGAIELALNLVGYEFRDRITVHREFKSLPEVRCHSGKLSQVFMNLLTNACQAIPGQGDVWIRTRSENADIVVEVEDNGVGIPSEVQERIFEPFFTTKPVGEGTGLGLSISYGIVRQHGGRIEVDSRLAEGTRFTIHLPVGRRS